MNVRSKMTPYEALGGEGGIWQLVNRFYALLDELPEAYTVRKMHPESLAGSAQSLFEFLSGWLGGPPLYAAKKGHPRLRMRHAPYAVDQVVRNEWMLCMTLAVQEQVADPQLRTWLLASFDQMASHMINTESTPPCHYGMPSSA